MKTKIEIKSVFGKVLFSFEKEDNTLKETLEEAVKNAADLCDADLRGADLCGANLCDADLRGAGLCGADLRDADLRDADLRDADLCDADLRGAGLCGANLRGADLCDADLRGADLSGANLRDANLRDANLRGAGLCDADLRGANLRGADLRGANLCGADLRGANLRGANLCDADLRGANLRGAGLCDAKNLPYIPLACPSEGAFVGWKKVKDRKDRLVKLEIPEDARRSSATTNKCRCDKAKVLAITSMDENESFDEVLCETHASLLYKVGEMVYPDSFDEDRWNECSNGIHFFINKQEAIDYIL